MNLRNLMTTREQVLIDPEARNNWPPHHQNDNRQKLKVPDLELEVPSWHKANPGEEQNGHEFNCEVSSLISHPPINFLVKIRDALWQAPLSDEEKPNIDRQ